MEKGLFAGLDVSTQSCKIVVLDTELEKVIYVDSVIYDVDLPQYETQNGVAKGLAPGYSESDPLMWLDALHMIFMRLRSSDVPQEQILSISVSGQQHGLVALDTDGNLTRPQSKLWNDFSTAEECEILTASVGGKASMIQEVGNSQRTGYTAPKILHMYRHEREIYQRSTTLFVVHNYINWFLTGGKEGGIRVMEPGDTSGMALWNPKTGQWSDKVIDAIDPGLKDKLPPLKPSDQSIGHISRNLSKKYGFSPNCTVDAGSGDNMYGAIGTGNVRPGLVSVSLGTSGTAFSFMEEPFHDPTGEIASYCDSTGHYLPLLCVSNLANGYNQILKKHGLTHQKFNQTVNKTKPGNAGKLLIPWYSGERTPDLPHASPVYFGFGLEDFTEEILCRAVLEGHILSLYDGFRRMSLDTTEIRLTGGLSQSEAWCQTIANVFEAETVPVVGEGAALGAALHAAWVWFKENGRPRTIQEVVTPCVVLDEQKRKKPQVEHIPVYRAMKELFHALSLRLRGQKGDDPFDLRIDLTSSS
ncbi:MAG: FGGY family carbohydrate kinase [Candidatus Aminicenantes bacterium]|jgi:xylulokinase